MQLTGKEIVTEGIITGYVPESVQQQGVDLRLMEVRRHGHWERCQEEDVFCKNTRLDNMGLIPVEGKTKLPQSEVYEPITLPNGKLGWVFKPGWYYEVIFHEGCKMPNNRVMVFITRSSGVRCGAEIVCGQFDAGFETEHMGCFLHAHEALMIECGARIAQTRITKTEPVEAGSMYNGQWQNDKQRKNQ